VVAVYDRNAAVTCPFPNVPLFSERAELDNFLDRRGPGSLGFVVAIGGRLGDERVEIGEALLARGLKALTVVHDRAWVAATAQIGDGCQVLGMAAVSEEAVLGKFCIVNTSASVDHECRLGHGVHIMPGATIAGCVEIGDLSTVGSNATVVPRVRIGARAMVGAGAVVTRDVPNDAFVVGHPARRRPLGA
jgi:sugar O-acyltransferase (sialic acid O-acetyltransferase NeuD family)